MSRTDISATSKARTVFHHSRDMADFLRRLPERSPNAAIERFRTHDEFVRQLVGHVECVDDSDPKIVHECLCRRDGMKPFGPSA